MSETAGPVAGDALMIVDVQRDFLPGGALAVPGGDRILPVLNRYVRLFVERQLPVVATRDWHPADHSSFGTAADEWPPHCVQGTLGAEFSAELKLPPGCIVISKGIDRHDDGYSAFGGTELVKKLHELHVGRLWVGGLVTEVCVQASVDDALQAGFDVILVIDAICPFEVANGDVAIENMVARGAWIIRWEDLVLSDHSDSALLTDLYQLTMLQTYFEEGHHETAVFEFAVRRLPPQRNFLVAAGLEQVLDYLEHLRFTADELDWLAACGRFRRPFVDFLTELRFTGDVHALPEGTICFADEPLVRVTAPLAEAQLVESRLINLLHYQTLEASKAARAVLVGSGKLLVEFGLRRAHGAEAGLLAARASYLAGFAGTSNVLAGKLWGLPLYGTMAHSLILSHADEAAAFAAFARANPTDVVLLIDTYDTEAGAERVVGLARQLAAEGITIRAVRLDSGDLAEHARRVRAILDAGGLPDVTIFASGNVDEFALAELVAAGAPIDGFGIGTRLDVSADAPYLDCAYKLQEYAGIARRKRSEGKATWPGRKQVYRRYDGHGLMAGDTVTLESDPQPGEALLGSVMHAGRRLHAPTPLAELRTRTLANLERLPAPLKKLESVAPYDVTIASSIRELAAEVDRG